MTDLHNARLAARLAEYPNSTTEAEAVKRVDEAVFDKVRTLESGMVRQATEWIADADLDAQAADALTDALRDNVRRAADRSTAVVDRDLAQRYERLKRDAERALAAVERAEREAAFHAAKLRDPYKATVELFKKFPGLPVSL
ncbi:MAG: hypothetical protein BGO95_11680 [Micrococcales bacterium 73-13]|nr:MAG: hypothetical protein BGO95_11680 [Micrococcales bacterium 73-13]